VATVALAEVHCRIAFMDKRFFCLSKKKKKKRGKKEEEKKDTLLILANKFLTSCPSSVRFNTFTTSSCIATSSIFFGRL